jgi:hypothetical protein
LSLRWNEERRSSPAKQIIDLEYPRQAQDRYGFILFAYLLKGNNHHLLGEMLRTNLSAVMHSIGGSDTTKLARGHRDIKPRLWCSE